MNNFYLNSSLRKQKSSKKYRYLSATKKDFRLSLRSYTSNKSSKIISRTLKALEVIVIEAIEVIILTKKKKEKKLITKKNMKN